MALNLIVNFPKLENKVHQKILRLGKITLRRSTNYTTKQKIITCLVFSRGSPCLILAIKFIAIAKEQVPSSCCFRCPFVCVWPYYATSLFERNVREMKVGTIGDLHIALNIIFFS